ncbi:senescence/dehydration-associated protein At4g35985, chloroplastic-like [Papaver somniferum]|uniref:senescence/dehydration-associated protein At4g35985, chloroplastic-like n=1 Tax=Papaver somniferum TaxID=3469 RepID=UPI000E6F8AD3|nr:senescence/dehydration-associated protein At4g35985, chloroplastic-like [Papaver somniferum]
MIFFSFLSKSLPSSNKPSPENTFESSPVTTTSKEELLLQVPGCTVNLVQEGEAEEIAKGNFNLAKLSAESVTLAIQIKVGDELQWPLTKEEPVVKLNELNYLFPLSMEDMNLTYGVSFSQQSGSGLTDLDSFLNEHSCFSGVSSSSPSETTSNTRALNWAELAPKIEKYSAILAQVMPGRTGEIIKGISRLSNACTQQVAKGGAMVITEATEETKADLETETNKSSKKTTMFQRTQRKGARLCLISSRWALDQQLDQSAPMQGGNSSHRTWKGPLGFYGAFSNFMDAAEAAEKKALSASSKAATKMVSERFGESAGEVTEDVFAIAGHAPSTAFNIVKIRKAVDPASSFSSAMVKNAIRMNP